MRILFSLYFPTFLLPYILAQSKKHPSYSSENLLNTNNLIHVPSPPMQIRTMAKDHRVARFLKSEDSNNMPDYDFEVARPYFVEENIVRRHPKSYNRRVDRTPTRSHAAKNLRIPKRNETVSKQKPSFPKAQKMGIDPVAFFQEHKTSDTKTLGMNPEQLRPKDRDLEPMDEFQIKTDTHIHKSMQRTTMKIKEYPKETSTRPTTSSSTKSTPTSTTSQSLVFLFSSGTFPTFPTMIPPLVMKEEGKSGDFGAIHPVPGSIERAGEQERKVEPITLMPMMIGGGGSFSGNATDQSTPSNHSTMYPLFAAEIYRPQFPIQTLQNQNLQPLPQPPNLEPLGCGYDYVSNSCKDLFSLGWCQNCEDFGNVFMRDCRCTKPVKTTTPLNPFVMPTMPTPLPPPQALMLPQAEGIRTPLTISQAQFLPPPPPVPQQLFGT